MSGITDPTEAYFKDGQWGWDGTQWRKLAMVWGYSNVLSLVWDNTDLPANWSNVDSGAVPTGEVWVITNISYMYVGTAPANLMLYPLIAGIRSEMYEVHTPATSIFLQLSVLFYLKADDKVGLRVNAGAVGDSLYGRAVGYIMKVTE